MKRFLAIFILVCTSIFLSIGVPMLIHGNGSVEMEGQEGLVEQNITGFSFRRHTAVRIYQEGKLIGTLTSPSVLNHFLKETYVMEYEKDYPDSELNTGADVNVVKEETNITYENADDAILSYLKKNHLFTLKCEAVEFADSTAVYDRIYVLKKSLFTESLHDFLCLFVSEDELKELKNDSVNTSLNSYGSVPVSLRIDQKITYHTAYAPVNEVYTDKDAVFQYLCYGHDTKPVYDTVEGLDTLDGFAARQGLTREQLIRINPDRLNENSTSVITGTSLCVTYLESPLTVTVVKHRLVNETEDPALSYVVNDAMAQDGESVLQEGEAGSENCLYEETWINGILMKGTLISSYTVKEKTDEIIAIKDDHTPLSGTGSWIMPVDHALILAGFEDYADQEGIDVINQYDRYGDVKAADTGTVAAVGYDETEGSYCVIDHHNGYYSHYGHLNNSASVQVGDTVQRGQVIGQIGASGSAPGAMLLFYITQDGSGTHLNACDGFMDCEAYQQE